MDLRYTLLGHCLGHLYTPSWDTAWDTHMYRDIPWVGPWQYRGVLRVGIPRYQPSGYPYPGYTPATHQHAARRALTDPAQRLADSVKTVISGSPIYHMDMYD